jgi:hypothetical protein
VAAPSFNVVALRASPLAERARREGANLNALATAPLAEASGVKPHHSQHGAAAEGRKAEAPSNGTPLTVPAHKPIYN